MKDKRYRDYIRWWFWAGAGMVTLIVIVGGITRLTNSGLSMTDWNLVMGVLPPLSEMEWREAFRQYKQFPEYRQLNTGMSLGEFKSIFFWEYIHRLLGRAIGLVFIGPFLWFWIQGHLTPRLFKRSLLLFFLGAAQGAMGWIMVKSGLVDVPRVSHYRLAAHLVFAFALAGFCSWYALDMKRPSKNVLMKATPGARFLLWISGGLLVLQVVWGAFVAGLDAGLIYNTFPLMNGKLLPRNMIALEPVLLNLVENPGTVQWIHRLLGALFVGLVLLLWIRIQKAEDQVLRSRMHVLCGLTVFQYVLGAATVLLAVPIALGVVHQLTALLIWISWLAVLHRAVEEGSRRKAFN